MIANQTVELALGEPAKNTQTTGQTTGTSSLLCKKIAQLARYQTEERWTQPVSSSNPIASTNCDPSRVLQRKRVNLTEWMMMSASDGSLRLVGVVKGHQGISDGTVVRTSAIWWLDHDSALSANNVYLLGKRREFQTIPTGETAHSIEEQPILNWD